MTSPLRERRRLTRFAAGLLGLMVCCASALAAPVSYRAQVITDISFNGVHYPLADVVITFHGDTANITPYSVTAPDGNVGTGLMIGTGTARLSFEAMGNTHAANFLPGQLFVSTDAANGGIGIGSFVGPNRLEPAYPLAFTLGEATTLAYNNDLSTEHMVSGHAWSCIGYPVVPGTGSCTAPDAYPLKTDRGNLVVYQRYLFLDGAATGRIRSDFSGSLNMGTFAIIGH